jgi:hypothetical protein
MDSMFASIASLMAQADVLDSFTSEVGSPLWKAISIITILLLAAETVVIIVMIQMKKTDSLVYFIIGAVLLAAMPAVIGAVYEKWQDGPFSMIAPVVHQMV